MKAKPKNWIFKPIPDGKFNEVFQMVDSLLIYNSLNEYFSFDEGYGEISIDEKDNINRLIEIYEFSILEGQLDQISLIEMYQDLFYLYRSKKIPLNDLNKIKFVYKIISYSYLGEQWESGKRYLSENFDEALVFDNPKDTWDIMMFKKTYLAFLYLIIKRDWKDLNQAVIYVNELREEQHKFEEIYLNEIELEYRMGRVLELVALYHYAKSVELLSQYFINGSPSEIRQMIDIHYDKIFEVTESSGNYEMHMLFQLLHSTFNKMISNSIWMVSSRVNSRVTNFVEYVSKSNQPIYELMYPQRHAVLDEGLLDPAHKAIVVNMPTSSGKTLIAQFRILQALNQFSDEGGWVVYVAPDRKSVV